MFDSFGNRRHAFPRHARQGCRPGSPHGPIARSHAAVALWGRRHAPRPFCVCVQRRRSPQHHRRQGGSRFKAAIPAADHASTIASRSRVRVILDDGTLGAARRPADPRALLKARGDGTRPVEVSPTARPPVCRIMDFGKYKYDRPRKRAVQEAPASGRVKEVKLRPKIEKYDYEFKKAHRRVSRPGRQGEGHAHVPRSRMAHADLGRKLLDRLAEEIKEIGKVEAPPSRRSHHDPALDAGTESRPRAPKRADEPERRGDGERGMTAAVQAAATGDRRRREGATEVPKMKTHRGLPNA